jgi:hypothetical protein
MMLWKAVLMVYRCVDVRLSDGRRDHARFVHSLSEQEVENALASFARLPALVARLSEGEAELDHDLVPVERCLDSLTPMGDGRYWPSPSDTRVELDRVAPPGARDSVFVLWPQNDLRTGRQVPSGGWGLAIGATDWSNGATYATVANASGATWSEPVPGEVWLHEWLHGVCDHYARSRFAMPPGDADGGERAGYGREPDLGWSRYYGDLMTGRVEVRGRRVGIPPEAWRSGSPLGSSRA